MTHEKIARHFLQYWNQDDKFTWKLADNAPHAFGKFVRELPKPIDMDMLHDAVACIATRREPVAPQYTRAVAWLQCTPRGAEQANKVMQISKPPNTFEELVRLAYKYEQLDVMAMLRTFFDTKITIA